MNTATAWWADVTDPAKTEDMTRPAHVGTVKDSVTHIHALVRHGYHHTFVEAALRAHLAKHGQVTS